MPLASNLKIYTEDGVTLVTSVTFTGTVPGTRSAAQTFRVVNDASGGEVEPAVNAWLSFAANDPVTSEPRLTGVRAVDERWIEFEAIGTSSSGVDQQPTGIVPVGRGRRLNLAQIPSAGWTKIKIYCNFPLGVPAAAVEGVIVADANRPGLAIEQGHSESDRDGVIAGVGDDLHSEIAIGGKITATGTPDQYTNWPDLAWLYGGRTYVKLAHQQTHNNLDSASVALGASEGYWCRFSLSTTLVQTKSLKFPLASQLTVPAVPTGHIDAGYCLVTDALAIGTADITSRIRAGRFEPWVDSGLSLNVGIGRGRVDNALVRRYAQSVLTCTASQTIRVWLLADGNLQTTTSATAPTPNALLLYTFPTNATDIDLTQITDYRELIGPVAVPVVFDWSGTLTDGAKARAVWPLGVPGDIRLPRGLIYRWHSDGSGNTAGVAKLDLKINGTTVFTSSGSVDRRPSIAYNASPTLSTAGLPEVVAIPAYALLEAEIKVTIAFNGTAPSGATLVLLVAPT